MKTYTTLPQQYNTINNNSNNNSSSLYNNNINNNNNSYGNSSYLSNSTAGMMPMRQNQTNVFALPMPATDVYSQRNNYNIVQQQQQPPQLQQLQQIQNNLRNPLRSSNKPAAMSNNELMQGKTNQPHPHQTYQELIEKSVSEVDRLRASNFPPPPPPPRVMAQERRRIAS